MSKLVSAILGLVLLAAPAAAAADDGVEARVQAVMECQSVSSAEARLRCYDEAIPPLRQALAEGTMVVKEKKGPRAREGVVKASGQWGEARYWVVLDNGDRWEVLTGHTRRPPPPPGTYLKLKRTPFGNYWISGPDWPESEAIFLGRES